MRKVTYFYGGTVADFSIPEDLFGEFTTNADRKVLYAEGELEKAQKVLEGFVMSGDDKKVTAVQTLAACFVWNFFNSNPDEKQYIEGDILIVDLNGDGATIEYASAKDVQIAPSN